MNRILLGLTVALLATSCLLALRLGQSHSDLDGLRGSIQQPWHADYEGRALKAKAIAEKVSVADIQRLSFPLTIELADRVCVELRSAPGVTDGGEVYCFNKETKKVVEHFQPPA